MYKLRAREERGKTVTDLFKSSHTFSFAQYFDPFNMGFSDLRVINDYIVEPSATMRKHAQANMEIINIILSGVFEYKNTNGTAEILYPNWIQSISSGAGVMCQESNISVVEPLHFIQIWILPNKKNFEPSFEIKKFTKEKLLNQIKLIVSGSGKNNSAKIHQDAEIYRCFLEADKVVYYELPENRKFWIQVTKGAIELNSNILEAGDGMSIVNERGEIEINGVDLESDFLIFNLRNLTI